MKAPYSSKSTLSVCSVFVSPASLKRTTLNRRSSNISALKAINGANDIREDEETTNARQDQYPWPRPRRMSLGFNPKSYGKQHQMEKLNDHVVRVHQTDIERFGLHLWISPPLISSLPPLAASSSVMTALPVRSFKVNLVLS